MLDLCQRAIAQKLAIVPGSAFLVEQNETCNAVRLNFSTPTDEQIVQGVEILGGLL
jgi:2-aminoadipate transaminase